MEAWSFLLLEGSAPHDLDFEGDGKTGGGIKAATSSPE